jgi:transcriptional repressor of dcmA and dcmR
MHSMSGGRLLNTREAARMLRVSEASIRRWSDAGLLAATRIGRRRERRFTEADLQHFMRGDGATPNGGQGRPVSGVTVRGSWIPLRRHLAAFYSGDVEQLRLAVPFLADGLRAGQQCVLIALPTLLDSYTQALEDAGIEVHAASRSGLLVTCSRLPRRAQEASALLEDVLGNALAGGATVIRMVGEMASVREMMSGSLAEAMHLEEEMGRLIKRMPMVSLWQYDTRVFDGSAILLALKAHPDMYDLNLGSFLV